MRHLIHFSRFLAIVAVFVFISTPLQSQQQIQIKNGETPVGHFFVEVLHNLPGAPMKSFLGNGGSISVDQENNKFILRMQNFVWYDPENQVDLSFNTNTINVQSDPAITFDQLGDVIKLKPVRSYIRDIYFKTEGLGKVKLLVPFSYEGGVGRFMQEFLISDGKVVAVEKVEKKAISSKDARVAWEDVDQNDLEEVNKYVVTFQDENNAKRYLRKAEKKQKELLLIQAKKAKVEPKVAAKVNPKPDDLKKTSEQVNEVKDLSSEAVREDIQAIVDTLLSGDSEEEIVMKDLYLTIPPADVQKLTVKSTDLPLQIQFHELGQEVSLVNRIPIVNFSLDTMVTINKELLKEHHLKGEFTSLNIFNAFGQDIFQSEVDLDTDPRSKNSALMYIIGISALLAGFGIWLFLNNRKKEKKRQETKKIFADKLKENQGLATTNVPEKGSQAIHNEVSKTASKSGQKPKIKIGSKPKVNKIDASPPTNSVPRKMGNSRFKITKRKTSGNAIPFEKFVDIANKYDTVNVDLTKIWSDTSIKNVYLAPEFIKSLDNFLADSSNDGIQNELQGAVPEVGGFMMGRFTKKDDGLEVLVERFVPFVPEYNDVFKIEIGTKTLVEELGDAQDKNPELEVIGWFHTHPGHGLFLSTSDLSVQRHFPNDYQVAMEIDSLTSGLDMSIFTRKSDGRMNNSTDRKENVGWFQWVEIDNSNVHK